MKKVLVFAGGVVAASGICYLGVKSLDNEMKSVDVFGRNPESVPGLRDALRSSYEWGFVTGYARMASMLKHRQEYSRRQLRLIEEAEYCELHGIVQQQHA